MRVTVRLFASLRDAAGVPEASLELPPGAHCATAAVPDRYLHSLLIDTFPSGHTSQAICTSPLGTACWAVSVQIGSHAFVCALRGAYQGQSVGTAQVSRLDPVNS